MKKTVVTYDKLVRDRIIDVIKSEGKHVKYEQIVDKHELLEYLDRKLIEEVDEYVESRDIGELADVLEVMYAILEQQGYTMSQVEGLRVDKKDKRGSFSEGIILKEVLE